MAEMGFPIGLNEYITEEPVQMWLGTRESGVFSSEDNLRVVEDDGMRIRVLDGLAWIHFSKYKGIMYGNTNAINFELNPSDAILKRISRVVLRLDLISNEHPSLVIKEGVFASEPVPPELERVEDTVWELCLAEIYIGPGIDSITQANITDTRLDADLCGLMRDGVDGIPTVGLLEQWNSWFENLKVTATGGAEELSEWIYTFKQDTMDWRQEFKEESDNWVALFKKHAQDDFEEWLGSLKGIVMEEDVVAGFALQIKELQDHPVTLNNNFDDLSAKRGAVVETETKEDGSILEKITIDNFLLAERTIELDESGQIIEKTTFYAKEIREDGNIIRTTSNTMTIITSQNENGTIEREVV